MLTKHILLDTNEDKNNTNNKSMNSEDIIQIEDFNNNSRSNSIDDNSFSGDGCYNNKIIDDDVIRHYIKHFKNRLLKVKLEAQLFDRLPVTSYN